MSNLPSLINQKYGRFLVLSYAGKKGYLKLWKCRCDCGNIRIVQQGNLRNGSSSSCGCHRREVSKNLIKNTYASNRTHGLWNSRTYKSWSTMKSRCSNPNDPAYKNYGGRGIKVCKRWFKFENFLADMGLRPLGTTIDRIDNNSGYSPGNCRWATKIEQCNNTRKTRRLSFQGQALTIREWSEKTGVHPGTINSRLLRGKPIDKVLVK